MAVSGQCTNLSLRLPPAAKRPVDFHQRGELAQLRLCEPQFAREEPRVRIEHFEIARRAALIADVRETASVLRGRDEQLLLRAELANLPIADERIGRFAERLLDALLIRHQRFLPPRFRELDLRAEAAPLED